MSLTQECCWEEQRDVATEADIRNEEEDTRRHQTPPAEDKSVDTTDLEILRMITFSVKGSHGDRLWKSPEPFWNHIVISGTQRAKTRANTPGKP
ncbi:hypothetical protein CEXT_661361 [Caerostris extrusa]|uniref:Uncharacterized protein n=1 Tax=Caerostris extrusa TaxID=172846 RepID=A0AAV4Q0G8_CAEEX|nr:hypothetical protein CEXT_661361 [Caerostris extrusa]